MILSGSAVHVENWGLVIVLIEERVDCGLKVDDRSEEKLEERMALTIQSGAKINSLFWIKSLDPQVPYEEEFYSKSTRRSDAVS